MGKEFQGHSHGRGFTTVVGFIKVKSNSPLSQRKRAGRLESSGCSEVLVELPCISLSLGKSRVSFKLSNLFPGFSGAWALPPSLFPPDFPRLDSSLLQSLVCLPLHMPESSALPFDSTGHVLSERHSSSWLSLSSPWGGLPGMTEKLSFCPSCLL